MKSRLLQIAVPACALLSVGCAGVTSMDDPGNGVTHTVTMDGEFDGFRRTYRIHVPQGYDPLDPVPLVVVLHGAFSTSAEMEKVTGFSELADKESFAVVYPDGIGILGLLQHWNAGHCCGKAAADDIDDVGFVASVIEDVMGYVRIDPARVYMVGFSNGAMLTHRFAAERPGLLAAAAPLAGSIGSAGAANGSQWRISSPRTSVPIIMFHGLEDDRIHYARPAPAGDSGDRRYSTVDDSSRFWWSSNGCERHQRTQDAAYPGVTIDVWSECDGNAAVQLFTLREWGHRWPGRHFTDRADSGDALRGFDAAEIIWSFFRQYERGQPSTG